MNDDQTAVTIVAGTVTRGGSGTFGTILRMGPGRVHMHITPEVAQQWLPILSDIAQEGQ
jgi:hypothetical protein